MLWVLIIIAAVGLLAFFWFARAPGVRRFRRGPLTGRWGRRV
jgi:hypothetical protein